MFYNPPQNHVSKYIGFSNIDFEHVNIQVSYQPNHPNIGNLVRAHARAQLIIGRVGSFWVPCHYPRSGCRPPNYDAVAVIRPIPQPPRRPSRLSNVKVSFLHT